MAAAQRDVALVAAQQDLLAGLDHAAVCHAGVERRLAAAPADGLDLLDRVRPRHQPLAALEQISLKVRAKAVADDGDVVLIHDFHQALDLRFFQKLRFVDDDAVEHRQVEAVQFLDVGARRAQPGARADDPLSIAVVEHGLEHQRVLPAFVIVVLHHDGVGRLGRSHRAVSEV